MTSSPSAPALQLKIGGPAGLQVTEAMLRIAEERIADLAPHGIAEITSRVRQFSVLVRTRPPQANRAMFRHMHDVRGMAGTFGRPNAGALADTACLYLDDLPDEATPDATLLGLLSRSLEHALRSPDDPLLGEIVKSSRAAVAQTRRREGRAA